MIARVGDSTSSMQMPNASAPVSSISLWRRARSRYLFNRLMCQLRCMRSATTRTRSSIVRVSDRTLSGMSMSYLSSTSITKSITETESMLRSAEMSVFRSSVTFCVLNGSSNLHSSAKMASSSVVIEPHLSVVPAAGASGTPAGCRCRRSLDPGVLTVPLDRRGEAAGEADARPPAGGLVQQSVPAHPVRMIEFPDLAGSQDRPLSRPPQREFAGTACRLHHRHRQIAAAYAVAKHFGCLAGKHVPTVTIRATVVHFMDGSCRFIPQSDLDQRIDEVIDLDQGEPVLPPPGDQRDAPGELADERQGTTVARSVDRRRPYDYP